MAAPQSSSRAVAVFLILFMLVGLGAIGFGGWNLLRSFQCVHWPTANGVIESAETKSSSDNEGHTTYAPALQYRYLVARVTYEGSRLAFGTMSASPAYAQGILARYPVGKTVTVYYAPNNAEEAVLETGVHGGTWVCFGVGTVFVLASAIFLQFARRAALPATASRTNPNDSISFQKPPILMGVIFILVGTPIFFAGRTGGAANGTPNWIVDCAGGMFVLIGLMIFAMRSQNKIIPQILGGFAVLLLLGIFNWIAFAPGERIGASTSPFGVAHGVNVKTGFAIITGFFDLAFVAIAVSKLLPKWKR